jgi:hypothetical protein
MSGNLIELIFKFQENLHHPQGLQEITSPRIIVLIGMSYCEEWDISLSQGHRKSYRGINGDLTDYTRPLLESYFSRIA